MHKPKLIYYIDPAGNKTGRLSCYKKGTLVELKELIQLYEIVWVVI